MKKILMLVVALTAVGCAEQTEQVQGSGYYQTADGKWVLHERSWISVDGVWVLSPLIPTSPYRGEMTSPNWNCPHGTWPRDMYTGPGGGMYTGPGGGMYMGIGGGMNMGPGGGLYTGPGGGLSTGPGGGLWIGPGGGLYTGPGGGLYTGPGGGYCSNRPPLSWLRVNGYPIYTMLN